MSLHELVTMDGEMAMSAAERVRLSRWVNRVEAIGDELLSLLRQAPVPLPREPVFDPGLVEELSRYVALDDSVDELEDFPNVRFLQLGNGHQSSNRDRALRASAQLIGEVTAVNKNTVDWKGFGHCHFAAFAHPKGAMVSSTRSSSSDFGGAEWHAKKNMVLFRDAGDGQCFVYVSAIEPLFGLRTIGHHGVTWENVEKVAYRKVVLRSVDAIETTDKS